MIERERRRVTEVAAAVVVVFSMFDLMGENDSPDYFA